MSISLQLMQEKEISNVLLWNIDTKDFLTQWSNYQYPLTYEQIMDRLNSDNFIVYSIIYNGNKNVGTIQLFNIDYIKKTATIGCYLVALEYRNNGIGTKALTMLTKIAFDTMNLNTLYLNVFDFNTSAKKCYENCGFTVNNEYFTQTGQKGYRMILEQK